MILKTPSQDELGFWNPHAKQYLSFDREKNSLVCGAYAGPSAAGDGNDLSSVDVWKYGPNKLNGGGQFQRQNDEWSEFQGDAFIAKFREVERGKDQIIIHDAGRDMYLRLNVDRAWWRVGDGAWNFIYDRM